MNWDTALFYAINGLAGRSEAVDWAMSALARPKTLIVPGTLALGYWVWVKRREAMIGTAALVGMILIGDLIGAQVKHLVARARPCRLLEDVHQLVGCGGTFGFPSNHALNTAAAAAFVQVLYPSSGWVTWPIVLLVGFSRVYVGAHFITDVLGGWLIGGGLGAGAALLLVRWSFFREGRKCRERNQT